MRSFERGRVERGDDGFDGPVWDVRVGRGGSRGGRTASKVGRVFDQELAAVEVLLRETDRDLDLGGARKVEVGESAPKQPSVSCFQLHKR